MALMSQDDCIKVVPETEVRDEMVVTFICFLLGYCTFRVIQSPDCVAIPFRVAAKAVEALSARVLAILPPRKPLHGPTSNELAVEGLAGLPHEITAQIAHCLPLHDFAAASAASSAARQRFGLSPEAWYLLAAHHHVDLPKARNDRGNSLNSDALGQVLREAFRCGLFRIEEQHIAKLGCIAPGIAGAGHASVLTEAARVVRGLMPRDGADLADLTCSAAERALQAHNPSNTEAASAASAFLQVARDRHDIFDAFQMDRLEGAYSSALQLQALMDVAMDDSLDELEIASLRSEDIQEVHRHCELDDALLEELRLHTEAATNQ